MKFLKGFLEKSVLPISLASGYITIYEFINKISQKQLKNELEKAVNLNSELVEKLNKLTNENQELLQSNVNIENKTNILENINLKNREIISNIMNKQIAEEKAVGSQQILEQYNITNEDINTIYKGYNDSNNIILQIFDEFSKSRSKYIGDNIINTIKEFIDNWYNMLNGLSLLELSALAHLLLSISMLIMLLNIISVLYSDFLLNYFKLEEKYPRLGKIIILRKKFNRYYLSINIVLIFIILLTIIYVNFKVLS